MSPRNYLVIRGLNIVFIKIKQKSAKVTSYSADYQMLLILDFLLYLYGLNTKYLW